MRKLLLGLIVVFGLVVAGVAANAPVDVPQGWKKIDNARKKGLPKTALKELEPILQQS